jgi:hypothetical protein
MLVKFGRHIRARQWVDSLRNTVEGAWPARVRLQQCHVSLEKTCVCVRRYLFSRHPLITEVLDIGDGLRDGLL